MDRTAWIRLFIKCFLDLGPPSRGSKHSLGGTGPARLKMRCLSV